MKRRNLLALLLMAVMVCGLLGCKAKMRETQLALEIKEADKECPISLGMVGDLLSVKYDEETKTVKLYLSLNDEVDIDALKENSDLQLATLKLSFSDGDSRELVEMIYDAGATMEVVYKSASTGKTYTVELTRDDLKDILDYEYSDREMAELTLANSVRMENAKCPYKVDEGLEMVRVYDSGDNVVYVAEADESVYDIDVMRENETGMKLAIAGLFTDPIVRNEIENYVTLDKGLVYRYVGKKSGDTFDLTFPPSELKLYLDTVY